jgi:transcriptional regulator with XRE-family HTH domain
VDRAQPRLREARLAAGLTQQALAARVGARQPHIARWELGQLPRVDKAVRLAAALDTTVEAIWSTPDPQRSPRDVGASAGVTAQEVPMSSAPQSSHRFTKLARPMVVAEHKTPRRLHRTDCPHQEPGVTTFRPATTQEANSIPTCFDCARKEV